MSAMRKVLVVDDDPVVGKSFQRVLAKKGYAVITAADGAEALAKLAAEDYDVVYTDIRMPGMDGIEVTERIKGRQPWLPVVIVSGYATAENEARAKSAGVSAVLHKPLSPAMIEQSAVEALRERDAAPVAEVAVVESPAAAAEVGRLAEEVSTGKAVVLLGLAALAGLGYVLLLPFVGLALLVGMPLWYGVSALVKRADRIGRFARNVGLFIAAPFIGLAYAIAFPFVGLGMLVWVGAKSLIQPPAAKE